MDTIYIKDLAVYARHGVLREEKELGQQFLVSLAIYLDLKPAGGSDRLDLSVDYAQVCVDAEDILQRERYDLIESCAEALAKHILTAYEPVTGVKVRIKKPWAPIGKPLAYAAVEIERFWHRVFIGLGANLGDRHANIAAALRAMNTDTTKLIRQSSYYETKPIGPVAQGDFINCAAEIKTLLPPRELMTFLLNIEQDLKRERTVRWGPRTIDLDVLMYDDVVSDDDEIILPHPRMHERLFVLAPLSEIAPWAVHPLLRQRISTLKDQAETAQGLPKG